MFINRIKSLVQDHFYQGVLLMLVACFWFASTSAIVRHISSELHIYQIVFFRNALGVLWLVPWAIRTPVAAIDKQHVPLFLFRSIIGLVGMYCFFYSLSIIPLSEAISLTFTVPLFTAILAIMFLNERMQLAQWMALLLGFIGMLVILRPGSEAFQPASLLLVLTALSWSITNIFVKKLTHIYSAKTIVFVVLMINTPLSLPLALTEWQWPSLSICAWLILLGFATNQAHYMITYAYSKTEVSKLQPFDFSRLIFASIIAYLAYGEIVDEFTIAGSIIIFISSLYLLKRHRRQIEA